MANIRIATRYAQALISAAEEKQLFDRVAADMKALQRMMADSRDFVLFLRNPLIKREKKALLFSGIFGKSLHEVTLGFLQLLAEKGREEILPDIASRFFALRDEKLGIVNVGIRAGTELTKEQQTSIQKRFEELTRKTVRLNVTVEKDLKGGFLARVGDTVFDGSVKRQLELLKEKFAEGVGVN